MSKWGDQFPELIDRFDGEHFFLSNFAPSPLFWGEEDSKGKSIVYPTLEHAYQAAKTEDLGVRSRIARCRTPKLAKAAGWQLSPRRNWDHMRIDVMCWLVKRKFSPGSGLAQRLIDTDGAYLREGNTWCDNFWGDCTCGRVTRRGDCRVPGQNNLGEALMVWREHLIVGVQLAAKNGGS